MRRTAAAGPALLALVVLATALILQQALRNHYIFSDEQFAIFGGRAVDADVPGGLFNAVAYGSRGPERLTGWLLGGVNALAATTGGDLRNARVALAICWALTALPAWALGRAVGLGRGQALLPAALVAVGVWSFYAITLLNTTLGLLTLCLQLLAMHRVTVRPSLRWELAVLVTTALVLLARVGHAPFVLALAPALLVQALRDRPDGTSLGRGLLGVPLHVVRTWPLLTLTAAVGVAAFVVLGQDRVLGAYGSGITQQRFAAGELVDQAATMLGRTTFAYALVPVALAGWWLVRQALRPDDRAAGAFAVLGLATAVIEVYVLYTAVVEDRYLVPLVPVVAVAASAALLRSRPNPVGVAVAALVCGWAAWWHGRLPDADAFGTFVAPSARFFEQVLGGRLSTLLPVSAAHIAFVGLVLGALVAIAVAVARRVDRAPWLGAAVGVAVVLFGVLGSHWATTRFVDDVGAPTESFAQVAWIDTAVGPGATVGLLADDTATDPEVELGFQQRYYALSAGNASLRRSVQADGLLKYGCCLPNPERNSVLTTNARTGRVSIGDGAPVPRLLAVPTDFRTFGFNTTRVATGPDAFSLQRSDRRLALGWVALAAGRYDDGWERPGRPLLRRTFPATAPVARGRRACWAADITAPILDEPERVRITGGRRPVSARIGPGRTRRVRVVLPRSSRPVVLRVAAARTGKLADGRRAGVRAAGDTLGAC